MSINYLQKEYDIVVVGGGLSGVCAAIASARHGAKTAIIQNRSMFGGNASSEIRMHIVGANCHSSKKDLGETGILEEILLENKMRNPYASFPVFDTIIWEKVRFQENLDSFLNTNLDDVIMQGSTIKGIICHQNSTETELKIYARVFIDATGHGTLGVMAGAESRMGSEGKAAFNEPNAPDEDNNDTMGNSIMFIAADRGEKVKFIKPHWAYSFSEDDLKYRPHANCVSAHADGGEIVKSENGKNQLPGFSNADSGYWWIELGGQYDDIIRDGEIIRDELLKCVYGVWDHLKNCGNHGLDNYDLDWVGIVPGYRESRRLEGDYILTENDIRENRIFDDAVAYGGWPMDEHVKGGILDFDKWPSRIFNFDGCYTIPYRCYYSKNIDNLMMAGRNISTSKMAFGSVRVMGTCAVGGQAVGIAAALTIKYDCSPRYIGQKYIRELQQEILKDDCFIPELPNDDSKDFALKAEASASSSIPGCEAVNVINGISRGYKNNSNCWESKALSTNGEWIKLKFQEPVALTQLRLTFDPDLSNEIMPSITRLVREKQVKGLPPELVCDYNVKLLMGEDVVFDKDFKDNGQRLNFIDFDHVMCDSVKVTVNKTHGYNSARIFEIRAY